MIIGSYAIKHHFKDFYREVKDIDVVKGTYFNPSKHDPSLKVEYLENDVLSSYYNGYYSEYISPNDLYTLKISHLLTNDINWEKHLLDVNFLKEKGCFLNDSLFYELYIPNERSNLELSKEEFFDNKIKCEIEHDELHRILNPSPTYLKVLKDNCEVDIDIYKWWQLNREDKLNIIKEECMVMAYERYRHLNIHYNSMYAMMLKKYIINHAPVQIAIFAIENHKQLYKCINFLKIWNK